jgi:hypothetical protein
MIKHLFAAILLASAVPANACERVGSVFDTECPMTPAQIMAKDATDCQVYAPNAPLGQCLDLVERSRSAKKTERAARLQVLDDSFKSFAPQPGPTVNCFGTNIGGIINYQCK